MAKDYYEILGINKTSTAEEVKKAYRRLAHKYHPDRTEGDEAKFKEINEAYQILSDKQKRAQYDQLGPNFANSNQGGGFSGFDPSGFSSGGGINLNDLGDLGDIFESFFSGSTSRRTYTQGNDLQTIQEITLEEAYNGVTKEIQFQSFEPCPSCAGIGHAKDAGTKPCDKCAGKGEIKEVKKSFFGTFGQVRACDKCAGAGHIPNKVCKNCAGEGRKKAVKKIQVEIASGVESGQLIKVSGAGEAGIRKAKSGDLYIQIKIKPHKDFLRQGSDLFFSLPVNLLDILLDKPVEVPTISGKKIQLKVSGSTNLNAKIKVSGAGMPNLHRSSYGNLYINLEIFTPKNLTANAKKLLEEIDKELG